MGGQHVHRFQNLISCYLFNFAFSSGAVRKHTKNTTNQQKIGDLNEMLNRIRWFKTKASHVVNKTTQKMTRFQNMEYFYVPQ